MMAVSSQKPISAERTKPPSPSTETPRQYGGRPAWTIKAEPGGELPAMVVADAVTRKLPGVLKKEEAAESESFVSGLLDFPQYTRPRVWRGREVPRE